MSLPKSRAGDVRLAVDPAAMAADAGLVFIGRIRTPWTDLDACPKNLREARQRMGQGGTAWAEVDPPFRPGLAGLEGQRHLILLYWMGQASRDLIVQAPAHRPAPVGTFALRSPARPNPVALAVVSLLGLEPGAGRLHIDAIDCLDGTPLLDIKPWLPGVDLPPGGTAPGQPA
ncbi:SAM-dependent methyltransferase [Marinibaculum pumilum]|uniref:SAM-dependent methyltransferase n=1 Tax=Marinibaculum pumilum TaxID=1766165 RepID=A0ABV7L387_9PROT